MASKDLKAAGVTNYRLRQLRAVQKRLPDINNMVWETSAEEVTQYELGGLSDEDILVEYANQTRFDNINDFLKFRLNNIKMEEQTIGLTGRTLNFIENLDDYTSALPQYTPEEIMHMTKKERLDALYEAFHDIHGSYPTDSDEYYLVQALTSK